MGRPIKKSRMSVTTGGNAEAGKIEVSAYFPIGGSLLQNDDAYIVSQRGSNRFTVHQADSTIASYTLKGVAPASLAEGEMCVKVVVSDDTSTNFTAFVTRFYNSTIKYAYVVDGQTITGRSKYTLGTEANEDSSLSGFASIDVI